MVITAQLYKHPAFHVATMNHSVKCLNRITTKDYVWPRRKKGMGIKQQDTNNRLTSYYLTKGQGQARHKNHSQTQNGKWLKDEENTEYSR